MNIIRVATFLSLALLFSFKAQAYMLNNWNVNQLDASGDYVQLDVLYSGGDTYLRLGWHEGDVNDSTPTAIGIDTVFYNCVNCTFSSQPGDDTGSYGGLVGATVDSIGGTTRNWSGNYGGVTAGGGFGDFTSRANSDSGGTDGITNLLFLQLFGTVSFTPNNLGSMFAVHVRYNNECSGWVSDGPGGDNTSDVNCGGQTTVPEPSSLWLLLIGAGGLLISRRLLA